jgi:N-acetyl-gamma-glutamyl-phosphate reductase
MIKVSIAGAGGYTGSELLRILIKHPQVEIATLTAETQAGKNIADVLPALAGFCDRPLVKLEPKIAETCDILFLALPHQVAMPLVPQFLGNKKCRVVDLSADYRLHDPALYDTWYHAPHSQPKLLAEAVYGLPELHREKIKTARLVANPGCYPTSVLLGLAPLMRAEWADTANPIADCKSGVSGAGRKAALHTQFAECGVGVSAYNIAVHRHTPEMEQELSALAGRPVRITFSPHLVPMVRGMLATLYVGLTRDTTAEQLVQHYRDHYRGEPFIKILNAGTFADTHHVAGSNYCHIGVQADTRNRRAVITVAIDNLMKGASGQAVQNMNLMLGFAETLGLDFPAVFP